MDTAMNSVYVRNVIALLRFLGCEQKDIAKQLGVSTAAVSLWGTGKRPVPEKNRIPLMRFLQSKIYRDQDEQEATLARLKEGFDDAPPAEQARRREEARACEARLEAIYTYLEAWDNEVDTTEGVYAMNIQRALTLLSSPKVVGTEPMKLSREDRDRLKTACRELLAGLEGLETFEKLGGRELSLFSGTPEEYMRRLAVWATDGEETEGTNRE
jgi:transcriptional regulator with XRE-family HTH domain